jgi:hypothetical protein
VVGQVARDRSDGPVEVVAEEARSDDGGDDDEGDRAGDHDEDLRGE